MSVQSWILKKIGIDKKVAHAYKSGYARGVREYTGAQINRLTADWIAGTIAVESEIRNNAIILRERARDLAKNNPLVKRWLKLCVSNIVGPNGFTFQSNVKIPVEDPVTGTVKWKQDTLANIKIEEAWREWCEKKICDVEGKNSFRQLCGLIIAYRKRDGQAFIRKIRNQSKFGFQLQIIPPEMLDEKFNTTLSNGNVVYAGIELDEWNRPVNYYFKQYNPQNAIYGQPYTSKHIKVPASDIIHYYHQDYINQHLGITDLDSVMITLRHLGGYDEATVVNARATAAKGMYLKQPLEEPEEYIGDGKDEEGNVINSLEPGAIELLPPGMEPYLVDPKFPSDQYDPYQKSVQKKISAGLDVAYASLSNDLSEANYSSNRVGLLDERAQWQMEQNDFIESVLKEIFPGWLEMALLKNAINLPYQKFDQFNKPYFVGRRWDWIDPLRDISATLMEMRAGIASPYSICASRGDDPEEILDELASWYKMAKEKGVPLNLDGVSINLENGEALPVVGTKGKSISHVNGNGKH
jgi:lambda family phage portal protein